MFYHRSAIQSNTVRDWYSVGEAARREVPMTAKPAGGTAESGTAETGPPGPEALIPPPPWQRLPDRQSRRRREPISREAIVTAAVQLLDREGLAGLSMRRLGDELGAGPAPRQPAPPLCRAHLDRPHPDGPERATVLRARARHPAGGGAAATPGRAGLPAAHRHGERLHRGRDRRRRQRHPGPRPGHPAAGRGFGPRLYRLAPGEPVPEHDRPGRRVRARRPRRALRAAHRHLRGRAGPPVRAISDAGTDPPTAGVSSGGAGPRSMPRNPRRRAFPSPPARYMRLRAAGPPLRRGGPAARPPEPAGSAGSRLPGAWSRTALALVVAGLGVVQLLPPFPGVPWGRHVLGVPLIVFGAVVAVAAYGEWVRSQRALRLGQPLPRSVMPRLLAAVITVIAVIAAVVVLVSALR